jgi:hypothetical protein
MRPPQVCACSMIYPVNTLLCRPARLARTQTCSLPEPLRSIMRNQKLAPDAATAAVKTLL